MKVKIGCCGFPVSREKYYKQFICVEIQKTFYEPPETSTVKRWREKSPSGFEYTIKAWQLITHTPRSPTYRKLKKSIPHGMEKYYGSFKPTDEVFQAWEKTSLIAGQLDTRVIIFQCPASFGPAHENKDNMKKFFSSINRDDFIFAWEPRGFWDDKEVESLCRDLDLVHVVDPFRSRWLFGIVRYYRLHGIGGYRYRYTEEDLNQLDELTKGDVDTYFMFNNVWMYENATQYRELVEEKMFKG